METSKSGRTETRYSAAAVAKYLGVSKEWVCNRARLLGIGPARFGFSADDVERIEEKINRKRNLSEDANRLAQELYERRAEKWSE